MSFPICSEIIIIKNGYFSVFFFIEGTTDWNINATCITQSMVCGLLVFIADFDVKKNIELNIMAVAGIVVLPKSHSLQFMPLTFMCNAK